MLCSFEFVPVVFCAEHKNLRDNICMHNVAELYDLENWLRQTHIEILYDNNKISRSPTINWNSGMSMI